MYETPHTKIAQILKVRYKCCIFTHEEAVEYINFVMDSRQGNHDIDTLTSQIK